MFRILIGFLRAALVDISIGLFFSHLLLKIWGYPPNVWIYAFGILFSVIVDVIEGMVQKVLRGEILDDHRFWAHYPLIFIPLSALAIYASLESFFFVLLACLCLLSHYIHDSLDIDENEDDGIAWLAPFRFNKYQISVFVKEVPNERIISIKEVKGIKIANKKITDWLEKFHLRSIQNLKLGLIFLFLVILTIHLW